MRLKFLVLANEPRLEEIVRGGPPLRLGDVHAAVEVVDSAQAYASNETSAYARRNARITSGGVALFDSSLTRKMAFFQERHGMHQSGQCDRATLLKLDELAVLKAEAQGRFALVLGRAPFTSPRFIVDEAANTKTTEFAAGTGASVVIPLGGSERVRLQGASGTEVSTPFPEEVRVQELAPAEGMRVFELTGLKVVQRAVPVIAATVPDGLPLARCWVEVSKRRRLTVYVAVTGPPMQTPLPQWEAVVNQRLSAAKLPFQVDVHPQVVPIQPRENNVANLIWPTGRTEVILNEPSPTQAFIIWDWQNRPQARGCFVESVCQTESQITEILREVFAAAPGTPAIATCDFAGPLLSTRSETLPPAEQAFSAQVRSLRTQEGFDDTATPPYQMIPLGEARQLELVDAQVDWSRVRVTASNALAVRVEAQRVQPDRVLVTLRGNSVTRTPIQIRAQLDGRLVARIEVSVKPKKQIRAGVALLRSDELGIQTATRREELRELFAGANEILQKQANIEIVLGRVQEQTVSRVNNPLRRFDFVATLGRPDPTAPVTIFFAWAIAGAWGTQVDDKIVINPERESQLALESTLAHEVGHFLGLEHSLDGEELLMSPLNDPHDNRLLKEQIETINPP